MFTAVLLSRYQACLARPQQDHTDDEQPHADKSTGLEALAQEEPAAQRGT